MMHKGVYINLLAMVPYIPVRSKEFAETLCAADFAPTHWGGDPAIEPFDVEQFREELGQQDGSTLPEHWVFRRAKMPKWDGQYGPGGVDAEFRASVPERAWARIFKWADDLAAVVQPEFGTCHLILPPAENDKICSVISLGKYKKNGPPWLGARSYIGKELANQIGMERLREAAARVEESSWGVIVDIIGEPWSAKGDALASRQREAMAKLTKCGLFGNYTRYNYPVPGPKWKQRKK
jgi:hypothetical protein